jgi:cell wall-associated NlpC family hydrolase
VNGKRRSLILLLLITTILSTSLVFTAQGSALTLKQRLAAVQQKLNVFYVQFDKAVEQYNAATSQLQTVVSSIAANERLLKVTQYNLDLADQSLQQTVVASYKSRQVNLLDVLLSTQNFDQLLTQLDDMQRFNMQGVDIVTSIQAAKQRIIDLRLTLAADKAAAKKLVAETQSKKDAVKMLITKQAGIASGLKRQIAAQQAAAALAARRAALAAQQAQSSSASVAYTGPMVDPGGAGQPAAVAIAQRYLGVPYVWGGASPSGFDCSGLVMYVYAQLGIGLPHAATMQQQMSKPVPLGSLQPGDLVFFGGPSFSYHVGIYVGGGQMINAPHTGAVVGYASIAGAWIGGRF